MAVGLQPHGTPPTRRRRLAREETTSLRERWFRPMTMAGRRDAAEIRASSTRRAQGFMGMADESELRHSETCLGVWRIWIWIAFGAYGAADRGPIFRRRPNEGHR